MRVSVFVLYVIFVIFYFLFIFVFVAYVFFLFIFVYLFFFVYFFFFFQAEDGIRDLYVTGVQTCALPISCQNFSFVFSSMPFIGGSANTQWTAIKPRRASLRMSSRLDLHQATKPACLVACVRSAAPGLRWSSISSTTSNRLPSSAAVSSSLVSG